VGKYLAFDLETFNAGKEYSMPPEQFVRTMQYAWDDGPVVITTDYDEMLELVRSARFMVGHNILSADLNWLFGNHSIEPLEFALQGRVIDTYVLASLVNPAPYMYTDSKGHRFYDAAKPERAMRWLSLENQAYQLNVPGKMGNLLELAQRHNPPKTVRKDINFGLIPLDDPDFLAYAEQDVVAVRHIYRELLAMLKNQKYSGEYVWREMLVWAINAQISKNGVTVNVGEAENRVAHLKQERDKIMDWLVRDFEFPTAGKQPWKSADGKAAIVKALATFGIMTEDNELWTRTASGAPSFSGDTMIAITEGTEADDFGKALATLQGQRSLAQLALDSVLEDGKAHPSIMCLQRSGRTSVTRPGLTVWTKNEEKRYMTADQKHFMVELDYSAADARAVAGVSGDREFLKRFQPGVDSHDLTGEIFFGKDNYYPRREELRPLAKMGGHAMAYRIGAKKLAANLNVTLPEAKTFIDNYQHTYPKVARWQNEITAYGNEHGFVVNTWGRRMMVDKDRSFTQSSALIGQSTTREMLYDGLIRIAQDKPDVVRWFRMLVHDAVVLSIPEEDVGWGVPYVVSKMEGTFNPKTLDGLSIKFPMEHGPLDARDWFESGH
jgi:DNA polymerase-1